MAKAAQSRQAQTRASKQAPEAATLPTVGALRGSQVSRRQRIVDTAYQMILESEGENVEIREVAERAGVALGTAYRYFGSKNRLFAEAFEKSWTEYSEKAVPAVARGKSNLERLRLAAFSLLEAYTDEPEFRRIWQRDLRGDEDPAVVEILRRCQRAGLDFFHSCLEGIDRADAESIAFIVASVVSETQDRVTSGEVSFEQARREVAKAVRVVLEFHDPTLPAAPRRPKR